MAWLKTHYPFQFMAARLTHDADDRDAFAKHLDGCRRLRLPDGTTGVEVLPPDVNRSISPFSVVADASNPDRPGGGRLLFGFSAIKGVGQGAVEAILAERAKGGPFTDVDDFRDRVDGRQVNRKVVETLLRAGAFDLIGGADAQGPLFREMLGTPAAKIAGPDEMLERLAAERELLGGYLTGHPIDPFDETLREFATHTIEEFLEQPSNTPITVGGVITEVKQTTTKRGRNLGRKMAIMKLGGCGNSVEIVLFPEAFEANAKNVEPGTVVMVSGRTDRWQSKKNIVADRVVPMDVAPLKLAGCLEIAVDSKTSRSMVTSLRELRQLLGQSSGGVPVRLAIRENGRVFHLALAGSNVHIDEQLLASLRQRPELAVTLRSR